MSLSYLLDEHVPLALQREILRLEPTLKVLRVGELTAPALSTLDPEILRWCEMSIGETAEELVLIALTSLPEEYVDLIQYLPVSF